MAAYSGTANLVSYYSLSLGVCLFDVKSYSPSGTKITEISVMNTAPFSAINIGLGRSSAELIQIGQTPLVPDDPNDPFTSTSFATAWTAAPSVPVNVLRRIGFANSGLPGFILSFPRGLGIASLGSLVLFNLTANSSIGNAVVSVQVEE